MSREEESSKISGLFAKASIVWTVLGALGTAIAFVGTAAIQLYLYKAKVDSADERISDLQRSATDLSKEIAAFKTATLAATRGEVGPAGPRGPQGPQGEPGPRGPKGDPAPAVDLRALEGRIARLEQKGQQVSTVNGMETVAPPTSNRSCINPAKFTAPTRITVTKGTEFCTSDGILRSEVKSVDARSGMLPIVYFLNTAGGDWPCIRGNKCQFDWVKGRPFIIERVVEGEASRVSATLVFDSN